MSQYKSRSAGLTRGLWKQSTGRAGRHTADNGPSVPAYSCELRRMHIKVTGRLHKQGVNMRRGWGFSFNLCVNTCVCMLSVPVGGITSEYACRSQKSLSGIFNHSPLFSFRDRGFFLLCGAGWPGTHKANQDGRNSQSPALPLERWNYRHVPPDGSPHFLR